MAGYHTQDFSKGDIGEFSKIEEEFLELLDAHKQKDLILILCELSDLYGAIEEYLKKWNMDMNALKDFSDKTKQAFKAGKR